MERFSIFNSVELLMEVSSNLGARHLGKIYQVQHIFAEIVGRHEKNLLISEQNQTVEKAVEIVQGNQIVINGI